MAGGIETVPDELLQEIFLRGWTERDKRPGAQALPPALKPPWVYAGVCKRWRSVAIGYGAIWCHLKVSVPDQCLSSDALLNALDDILKRSSGRGLTLDISNVALVPCVQTLRLLYNVAQRWESVKLYTVSPIDIGSHVTSWSALTNIELDFSRSWPSAFPSVLDLSQLPKLRSYTERTLRNIGTTVLLPLQSVESIEIHMRNDRTHCRLGRAPRLKRLHIDNTVYIPLNLDYVHLTNIVIQEPLFPALRELHLRNADCMLRFGDSAHLTMLFIYMASRIWSFTNGEANMSHLAGILASSRTSLISLYLSGNIDWRHDGFRERLLSVQSLQALQLGISAAHSTLNSLGDIDQFAEQLRDDFLDLLCANQSPHADKFVLACRVFGTPEDGNMSTSSDDALGLALIDLVKGVFAGEKIAEVYLHGTDSHGFGRMFKIENDGRIVHDCVGKRFTLQSDGSVMQEPIERA